MPKLSSSQLKVYTNLTVLLGARFAEGGREFEVPPLLLAQRGSELAATIEALTDSELSEIAATATLWAREQAQLRTCTVSYSPEERVFAIT